MSDKPRGQVQPEVTVQAGGGQQQPGGIWIPDPIINLGWIQPETVEFVGGQAQVYRVRKGDAAAIAKVYLPGHTYKEDVLRKLSTLNSPRVARLLNYGVFQQRAWELQEAVQGQTLAAAFTSRKTRLSTGQIIAFVREMEEALNVLHAAGIEHKDLKPANILLRSVKPPFNLCVIDFGLATLLAQDQQLSALGRTLAYAPPEAMGTIIRDEVTGTAAERGHIFRQKWDCWSLGIMVAELSLGAHPFGDVSEVAVTRILQLDQHEFDRFLAAIPDPQIQNLVLGLLRRNPEDRWGDREVALWLRNPDDKTLVIKKPAGAAPSGGARGFKFKGHAYQHVEDLGAAFLSDIEAAALTITHRRDELLAWLQDELGRSDLVVRLRARFREIAEHPRDPVDAQTRAAIAVGCTFCPGHDVISPDFTLTPQGIVEAAKRAQSSLDKSLPPVIGVLGSHLIDDALKTTPSHAWLKNVAVNLKSTLRAYDSRVAELSAQGVNGLSTAGHRQTLDFLTVLAIGDRAIDALRENARKLRSEAMDFIPWYKSLGTVDTAGLSDLWLMVQTSKTAQAEAENSPQWKEELERRLEVRLREEAAGTYSSYLSWLLRGSTAMLLAILPAWLLSALPDLLGLPAWVTVLGLVICAAAIGLNPTDKRLWILLGLLFLVGLPGWITFYGLLIGAAAIALTTDYAPSFAAGGRIEGWLKENFKSAEGIKLFALGALICGVAFWLAFFFFIFLPGSENQRDPPGAPSARTVESSQGPTAAPSAHIAAPEANRPAPASARPPVRSPAIEGELAEIAAIMLPSSTMTIYRQFQTAAPVALPQTCEEHRSVFVDSSSIYYRDIVCRVSSDPMFATSLINRYIYRFSGLARSGVIYLTVAGLHPNEPVPEAVGHGMTSTRYQIVRVERVGDALNGFRNEALVLSITHRSDAPPATSSQPPVVHGRIPPSSLPHLARIPPPSRPTNGSNRPLIRPAKGLDTDR